ncbi:MAG: hypothetical protein V4659_00240 [Pseudomonadota bacterium]
MSAVGAWLGAKGEQDSLRSQARIAEINARIMDGNARNTLRVGNIEESRVKLAGAQAKSSVKTSIASSGIDIAGSNTALARLTGNDLITEVDAQTVRENALRAAWGQRIEAGNMRRGAASARATAKGISPGLATVGSLLGSAQSVALSWYGLNKEGAFDKAPAGGSVTVGDDMGRPPVWGEPGHEDRYPGNRYPHNRGNVLLSGWGF